MSVAPNEIVSGFKKYDDFSEVLEDHKLIITPHAFNRFIQRFGSPHPPANWVRTLAGLLNRSNHYPEKSQSWPYKVYSFGDWLFVVCFYPTQSRVVLITCWRLTHEERPVKVKYRHSRAKQKRDYLHLI